MEGKQFNISIKTNDLQRFLRTYEELYFIINLIICYFNI